MEKHEGYKIKLAIGQKSKWVKFMEGERKLKLRGEAELHNNRSVNDKIYTPVQSENTKKEESKDKINLTDMVDDGGNHQRLS